MLVPRLGSIGTLRVGSLCGLGCVLALVSPHYAVQFLARFLTGVGIGAVSSVGPAFVVEHSRPEHRGKLGGLFQLTLSLGIFLASVVSYAVLSEYRDQGVDEVYLRRPFPNEEGDRALMLLLRQSMIIPVVFAALLVILVWIPLSKLTDSGAESTEPPVTVVDKASPTTQEARCALPKSSSIFSYPRAMALSITGAVALQLTGVNAIMFYCGKFMEAADISQRALGTVIVMAITFVATAIALGYADRVGRRCMLIPSLAIMSLSMMCLSLVSRFCAEGAVKTAFAFILLALYLLAFEFGPGIHFWIVCNEVLPSSIAQQGFSVVNIAQWLFLILVTLFFPPLNELMGPWVFWLFAGIGVACTVFFYLCLPETRHKSKEEISEALQTTNWVLRNPKQ